MQCYSEKRFQSNFSCPYLNFTGLKPSKEPLETLIEGQTQHVNMFMLAKIAFS